MKAIKISIILMMIMPHTSFSMLRLLRGTSSKKYVRNCSSVYQPQAFEEEFKRTRRANYDLIASIAKRNKKWKEKINKQNDLIEIYKKDPQKNTWWASQEYAEKFYWLEKEVQMVAQEKY